MKNIHIFIWHTPYRHTCAHTRTRLLPIWTPDLFQPSDSHWHLPLELSLLTCWSWWEWMMLLLEEKRRRKEEGGAGGGGGRVRWKEENQGRQAPHAAPRIHLDPLFARKVTGRLNLTSSLQKSRCCGHPWGTIRLSALSHNLSFSLTVYCHHGRDIQYVVLDRPPETSW